MNSQNESLSGDIQAIMGMASEALTPSFTMAKSDKFDPQSLWERIDGDAELLRDLVEVFQTEYPSLINRIESGIVQGQPIEVQRASHKMKGSLLQFSAPAAAALAGKLEGMGERGTMDGAKEFLHQLRTEVEDLMKSLRSMVASKLAP